MLFSGIALVGPILLVGVGDLGFEMLHFLARTPRIGKIIATTQHEAAGIAKVDQAIAGAAHQGFYPDISYKMLDVFDVEKTTEFLKEVKPDLVINGIKVQPWRISQLHGLPGFEKIGMYLAPWLPSYLLGSYKLMQAVKKSGVDTRVVNTAYPDVTNPVLGKVGLAPTTGGGNIALVVPRIQGIVSEKLNVPMREVTVYIVGHHGAMKSLWTKPERPISARTIFTKIFVGPKDVSDQFTFDKLAELMPRPSAEDRRKVMESFARTGRMTNPQHAIASSFLSSALAIYFDTKQVVNTTGPGGLHGGYPARLSRAGAEVVLPAELTLEEAIEINTEGGRFDGIEKIKDDGTAVFTEDAANGMREALGYECEELKISEVEERFNELNSLAKKILAQKVKALGDIFGKTNES